VRLREQAQRLAALTAENEVRCGLPARGLSLLRVIGSAFLQPSKLAWRQAATRVAVTHAQLVLT